LYAMSLGGATALLAAVPGIADFLAVRRDSRARSLGRLHLALNLVALSIYAANLWLRWGPWADHQAAPADRVEALGFLLSLVGLGIVSLAAYFGGRLVYGHGISVGRHRREAPPPRRTVHASSKGSADGFARVAQEGAIPEGGTLRAEVDGTIMTVVLAGGRYFALEEFCSHRFGPLSEGRLRDGQLECPWHLSEFDLRTGEVVSGPAKAPVATYEVRVQDGEIRVRPESQTPAVTSPSTRSTPGTADTPGAAAPPE
jgi:nitrite reductase/ring-hydroxylating ferredoxin subunit